MLKKRAYLARFLVDVEMPPELLLEDDVTTLSRQYEELQGYFKTTHKHLESLRREERDMVSYKEQVKALDIEKEHLHRKLLKLNNELQVSRHQSGGESKRKKEKKEGIEGK